MSKKNFDGVLTRVQGNPVFNVGHKKQAPPAYQLMVFLKYVGTDGNGASSSSQRSTVAIGYGTAALYYQRVTKTLRSLLSEYIRWPNANYRVEIAQEIQCSYNFPHCVSIDDGTLFPSTFEPQTADAPDYLGRKYGCFLSTMIVCDHKLRIRHYLAGFPGSAPNNRIWKATRLCCRPTAFFAPRGDCVGDLAFEHEWYMVSAFKKPKDKSLLEQHGKFNKKLASMRIISEYCIGMLKGCFP